MSSYSHSSRASPGNHSLRTIPSDLSSRTGASSVSGGLGASFLGDSSMASTNTNLTSFANGTNYDGDNGMDVEEEVENVNNENHPHHLQSNGKSNNGYKFHSSDPASSGSDDENTNLTISDMSFLLSLCPTSIVEPIGASNEERLLLPDWSEGHEDESTAQSSSNQFFSNGNSGSNWSSSFEDSSSLAKIAKMTSSAKMSNPSNSSSSANQNIGGGIGGSGSSRNRFIIDGSAPLKLLDRKTLAETQYLESKGKGRPTKGGLSIGNSSNGIVDSSSNNVEGGSSSNQNGNLAPGTGSPLTPHPNGNPRKRSYRDELFEVVDPVSLLGALGE